MVRNASISFWRYGRGVIRRIRAKFVLHVFLKTFKHLSCWCLIPAHSSHVLIHVHSVIATIMYAQLFCSYNHSCRGRKPATSIPARRSTRRVARIFLMNFVFGSGYSSEVVSPSSRQRKRFGDGASETDSLT